MESKLILNLRLEVGDLQQRLSLMNLILEKIKELESSHINVEYFELRLHRQHPLSPRKEAYMKIDANNWTFTDSEIANRWDDAIINPCGRLRRRFLDCGQQVLATA